MYPVLIFSHSILRWLVLASLIVAIYRGTRGWARGEAFSKADDIIRHVTATFAHIQLLVGWTLYFNSPFIDYFRSHFKEAIQQPDLLFFGIIHISMMTIAIIVATIGSSLSKRQTSDIAKFRTMTLLFVAALLIILIAVPWPFSPLSARPYFRTL